MIRPHFSRGLSIAAKHSTLCCDWFDSYMLSVLQLGPYQSRLKPNISQNYSQPSMLEELSAIL